MRRTFTLIEVVVALSIMVFIATITWQVMAGTLRMRDWLESEDLVDRSTRVAFDRITRELRLAYLTKNTGAINTYRTVFIGRDNGDDDALWFATLAHQRLVRNAREGDQGEVTLWLEDDPDGDGKVLLHRESGIIDQEPAEDGAILPLARGVTRFDLKYLDPTTGEWRDEWDTTGADTPNRLPRAVQVFMTVLGPDPDDPDRLVENNYLTTVLLDLAPQMSPSAFNTNQ